VPEPHQFWRQVGKPSFEWSEEDSETARENAKRREWSWSDFQPLWPLLFLCLILVPRCLNQQSVRDSSGMDSLTTEEGGLVGTEQILSLVASHAWEKKSEPVDEPPFDLAEAEAFDFPTGDIAYTKQTFGDEPEIVVYACGRAGTLEYMEYREWRKGVDSQVATLRQQGLYDTMRERALGKE